MAEFDLSSLDNLSNENFSTQEREKIIDEVILLPSNEDIIRFLYLISKKSPNEILKIFDIISSYPKLYEYIKPESNPAIVFDAYNSIANDALKITLTNFFKTLLLHKKSDSSMDSFYVTSCINMIVYLPSENLTLAEAASQAISIALPYYPTQLCPEIFNAAKVHASTAPAYIRYLSLVTKSIEKEESVFMAAHRCGLIAEVLRLCQVPDVLAQLNYFELVVDIASSPVGIDYLCSHSTIHWLISCAFGPIQGTSQPTCDPLIASEAMRVLGQIYAKAAHHSINFLHKMEPQFIHHFLRTIMHYFANGNETEKLAGLGVLMQFAQISTNTLKLVTEYRTEEGSLVMFWVSLLNGGKPDLVAAVLHSFANVLRHPDEAYAKNSDHTELTIPPFSSDDSKQAYHWTLSEENDHVSTYKNKLYSSIGETLKVHSLVFILRTAKQPVDSTRHAAMDLLQALASQQKPWGMKELFQNTATPGHPHEFFDFIKDRMSEYSKEGKDWKFSIIEAIAQSSFRNHLSEEVNQEIDLMLTQGPYYKPKMVAEPQLMNK